MKAWLAMPKIVARKKLVTSLLTSLLLVSGGLASSASAESSAGIVGVSHVHGMPKGISLTQPESYQWNVGSDCTNVSVNIQNKLAKYVLVRVDLRAVAFPKLSAYAGDNLIQLDPRSTTNLDLGCIKGQYPYVSESGIEVVGTITAATPSTVVTKKLKIPSGVAMSKISFQNLNFDPISNTTQILGSFTNVPANKVLRISSMKLNGKTTSHAASEFIISFPADVSLRNAGSPDTYVLALANVPGDQRTNQHFAITGSIVKESQTPFVDTHTVSGVPNNQPVLPFWFQPSGWTYNSKTKKTELRMYLPPMPGATRTYDLSGLHIATTSKVNGRTTAINLAPVLSSISLRPFGFGKYVTVFEIPGNCRFNHSSVTLSGDIAITDAAG